MLAVFDRDFIIAARDHSSVAENPNFHVAHRSRDYVGRFDLGGSLRLRLTVTVWANTDLVIGHQFFKCRGIVIFFRIEPGLFRGLERL